MKRCIVLLALFGLSGPVLAESCSNSREYILEGLAGGLPKPAAGYQDLFKVCMESLNFANVKDAYVLKDGGIAIVPARNTTIATAQTLAQFCQRFPKNVARFLTPREQKKSLAVPIVVMMSSTDTTSCKTILGAM